MIRTTGSVQLRRIIIAFSLGILTSLGANVATADLEDDIRARISPVGQPCVVGERCAASVATVSANAGGGAKDPVTVYDTFCVACHGTGANESPVLGNVEAWEPRIAKGMDVLYENALNGFNNNLMPARGLCMDCTDDEIKATVNYLVESSQ